MKSDNCKVPFHDLKEQHTLLKKDLQKIFAEVLDSQKFILGKYCEIFEEDLARYLGVKHVIGVGSGTDALTIALRSLGVGENDEVITVPNSFVATAEAVFHSGGKPVFVDVEQATALMDIKELEKRITKKTRVILPVHIYGQPADLDPILKLAKKRSLVVVEDACQAIGSLYHGKKAGTFGKAGCFSFYPGKNLGGLGDGGAIATNNSMVAEKARKLRDHGSLKKYHHDLIGYNSRLDGLQAAVLSLKLKYLDSWNEKRGQIAKFYRKELAGLDWLKLMAVREKRVSNNHLFVVRVEPSLRDRLQKYLDQRGIRTGIHYPNPIHKILSAQNLYPKEISFPVTETLSRSILSLPIYPELSLEMAGRVVEAIHNFKP